MGHAGSRLGGDCLWICHVGILLAGEIGERTHSSSPPVSARKAESPPGAPSQSTSTSPVQPANAQSSQPPAQELAPATSSAVSGASPNNQTSSGRFSVVIKAREDSWLFIDADGKEVMHDLLVAPAEKSVEAEKEI